MAATMSSVTRRLVFVPAGEVNLEGAFESPARASGVVVFAHGSGSSRASPRNRFVARELHRAGFATLLLDLLTADEDSDGAARFDVALLSHRLADAVRWVAHAGGASGLPVGLFGASTGAAAALEVAAALGPAVSAVVSRGGRVDLATPRTLSRIAVPTLFVVGANDTSVVILNQAAYERLGCTKSLEIIPGATHLFEEPGALEKVAGLAAEWFHRYLGAPASPRPGGDRAEAARA